MTNKTNMHSTLNSNGPFSIALKPACRLGKGEADLNLECKSPLKGVGGNKR
jgi:hypothetical protein